MQVKVGTVITYKSKNYICMEIEKFDIEKIAKDDHVATKATQFLGENVRCLTSSMEPFEVGDAIHITGERLMLECPGEDLQWIWTSHHITKIKGEEDANTQRVEGDVVESSGDEVESIGPGDSSGEGDGEESAGEVGGPVHQDGRGGEVGFTGNPQVG